MAETLASFVARRRPDWSRLEALLGRPRLHLGELDELDALYRRASADLAAVQASWPGTDVQRFLNQLCGRAFGTIYQPPPARLAAVRDFYLRDFPRLVRATLPETRVAAGLLFLGVLLGALTVALHPDGAQLLVPANLRELIARGQLWTDSALQGATPSELAASIFFNNLRVMILAFASGITAGVGTVLLVFGNGLSIGALVAECFRGGVGPNILTFMAAHGPVELSLICVTGGAGLHLGRAMVEPQERSRAAAVRAHAQVAVQLVLGCAPFMVAIGVVEGFVSPGPYFPWPLKALAGALSGAALWRWWLTAGRGPPASRAAASAPPAW